MSAIRPLFRTLLPVTYVALASSCAVGPSFHPPTAPANAGYTATPLPESSTAAPVHGGEPQRLINDRDIPFEWWQLFQSSPLNALVPRSFEANPTVPAALAALAQAQELVRAQRGFYYPTVAAGF